RHTRCLSDWSSDVCSSDLEAEEQFTRFLLAELEQTILDMGPETVCLVHMEPVQNAGGSFVAPVGYWAGVRDLCTKYDILLSADEIGRASCRERVGAGVGSG